MTASLSLWYWSKRRGLSEHTKDTEFFVSDAQHEVLLDALLRHSQDGRGLSSTDTASTLGFMCRRVVPCLPSRLSP